MTAELIAILDGREMGCIVRDKGARLTFTYNEEWRTNSQTQTFPHQASFGLIEAMSLEVIEEVIEKDRPKPDSVGDAQTLLSPLRLPVPPSPCGRKVKSVQAY